MRHSTVMGETTAARIAGLSMPNGAPREPWSGLSKRSTPAPWRPAFTGRAVLLGHGALPIFVVTKNAATRCAIGSGAQQAAAEGLPQRRRLAVTPVRRWRWQRGHDRWRSRGGGEASRARGSRPRRGARLGWRLVVTFPVFGPQLFGADQDTARAIEVHQRMPARPAEAHDGSAASRPYRDRGGSRRDPIADGPVTGDRFLTDALNSCVAARRSRRAGSWRDADTRGRAVWVRC